MLSGIFKKKTRLELLNKQLRLVTEVMKAKDDKLWLRVFEAHLDAGTALASRFADPNEISTFAREVESEFGGMGSFNDAYYSTKWDALKESLFSAIQSVLKECWAARGKPVYFISNADLFEVGEAVNLVKGTAISIGRDEVERYAPESRLTYRVMERMLDDVDGMPRYRIKADSHVWLARHAALVRV